MMTPMTSWSSFGGGGARVSGWNPGGEESPPTGRGLIRTTVIMERMDDADEDGNDRPLRRRCRVTTIMDI